MIEPGLDDGRFLRSVIATDRPRISVDTVRLDPISALIKVCGEIDRTTDAALSAVLRGHLAAGRRFLRLDLSGVTALDASALAGLSGVHQEVLRRRGTLVITGVRSVVARVLRVTGLDRQLLIGGTRSDDELPPGLSLDLTSSLLPH